MIFKIYLRCILFISICSNINICAVLGGKSDRSSFSSFFSRYIKCRYFVVLNVWYRKKSHTHKVIHLTVCFFQADLGFYLRTFQNGWSKGSKKHPPLDPVMFQCQPNIQYTQAPTVNSSNTSGVNLELLFPQLGSVQYVDGPPSSTFTNIFNHVYNGPLQQHSREYESSLYHVCMWWSGCAVWTPPVCNTLPQVENMILFCITVPHVNPPFAIHHCVCSKLVQKGQITCFKYG